MDVKYKVLTVIGVAVVAGAFGRYTAPSKVVEKEHVVYQDRVVEKKVYVKDTNTKKNVVTVKLVTIKPDGTRTIETRTYDKSDIEITQKDNTKLVDDKHVDSTIEKTTEYKKEDTIISLGTKFDSNGQSYGLLLNKRILGPIHGGAFGFTDKSFGLSLGLGF